MRKLTFIFPLFLLLSCLVVPFVHSYSNADVQVGIFYYVWYGYGSHQWLNEYPSIIDKPLLGWYDGDNVSVIEQHFTWLSDLMINFVVVSWFGVDSQEDNNTKVVFETVKNNSFNVKLCILVEPFNETVGYNYTAIYDYVYDTYVVPYPSVYYKPFVSGYKPLLCFFNAENLTDPRYCDFFTNKDSRFDVKVVGGQDYVDWLMQDLTPYACPHYQRQICVSPRYDDSGTREGNPISDRDYTEGLYSNEWDFALSLVRKGAVDFITVYSFNEYHERSQIEPCRDATGWNSDPYYLYNMTKEYIDLLHGINPLSEVKPTYWYQNPILFGVIALGICLGVVMLWKS